MYSKGGAPWSMEFLKDMLHVKIRRIPVNIAVGWGLQVLNDKKTASMTTWPMMNKLLLDSGLRLWKIPWKQNGITLLPLSLLKVCIVKKTLTLWNRDFSLPLFSFSHCRCTLHTRVMNSQNSQLVLVSAGHIPMFCNASFMFYPTPKIPFGVAS